MRMRGRDLSESRLNCPFGGRVLLLFPLPQIQDYWYVVHAAFHEEARRPKRSLRCAGDSLVALRLLMDAVPDELGTP